jgi:hypothetical protein
MRALFSFTNTKPTASAGVLRLDKTAGSRGIYRAGRWRLLSLSLTAFHVCRLCPVRPGDVGLGRDGGGVFGSVGSRGDQLKTESATVEARCSGEFWWRQSLGERVCTKYLSGLPWCSCCGQRGDECGSRLGVWRGRTKEDWLRYARAR